MAKRYFWLKLHENFFEREEIKVIEMQPNGVKYINFYLKLLLKSLSTDGRLMFRNIMPYTPEILSRITNTDIDTVKVAIDIFVSIGLMDKLDDGALFMKEIENMTGSETEWAVKKREYRKSNENMSQKIACTEDNVLLVSSECQDEKSQSPIRDKSIEIRDKSIDNITTTTSSYIEKENSSSSSKISNITVFKHVEKCNFIISPMLMEKIASDIEDFSPEEVMKAAEIADEQGNHRYSYLKGILENRRAKNGTGRSTSKDNNSKEEYDFTKLSGNNNSEWDGKDIETEY